MRANIRKFLSLIRFSHTLFALPFALIGFFLGIRVNSQLLPWGLLGAIILCMVFARSAAMGFNRWLDSRFDKLNPRTASREIPAGLIRAQSALIFVLINCLAFVATAWMINRLCGALSFLALAVILGYSYTKRFTPFCHLILGVGLALAPLGAWLAVTDRFASLPILFSLIVLFWVSGFDIIYALQDVDFDRSMQLHSIPAWLGRPVALRVSRALHLICAIFVAAAGLYGHFGPLYWTGAVFFTGALVYQQGRVSPADLSRVNPAFMTANGIASCIFAVFAIGDLITGW
ncbi:MAG TPA: UbiA-like polyprenyltransferase [Chitinophagaceae bacterium]|nr:UbiA-like polyprenyltransferase [Chitinophagaceae bacterium]